MDRILNDKKHIIPKLVEGIFNYYRWLLIYRWLLLLDGWLVTIGQLQMTSESEDHPGEELWDGGACFYVTVVLYYVNVI